MPETKKSPTTTWHQPLAGGKVCALIFPTGIDGIPHAEETRVVRGLSNIWPSEVVKPFFTPHNLQARHVPEGREGAVDLTLPGEYRSGRAGVSEAAAPEREGGQVELSADSSIKKR